MNQQEKLEKRVDLRKEMTTLKSGGNERCNEKLNLREVIGLQQLVFFFLQVLLLNARHFGREKWASIGNVSKLPQWSSGTP